MVVWCTFWLESILGDCFSYLFCTRPLPKGARFIVSNLHLGRQWHWCILSLLAIPLAHHYAYVDMIWCTIRSWVIYGQGVDIIVHVKCLWWHDNRFEVNWPPEPTLVLRWISKFFLFGALPSDTLKLKHTKNLKEIPSRHVLENLPEKACMNAFIHLKLISNVQGFN